MHFCQLPTELSSEDYIIVELDRVGRCRQFGAGYLSQWVEIQAIDGSGHDEDRETNTTEHCN